MSLRVAVLVLCLFVVWFAVCFVCTGLLARLLSAGFRRTLSEEGLGQEAQASALQLH